MKKIIALTIFVSTLFTACKKKEVKNYATIHGKITNKVAEINTLKIINSNAKSEKEIQVNEDGSFQDTLKVTAGKHIFLYGNQYTSLYLKNNYDLTLNVDFEKFDETVKVDGDKENVTPFYLAIMDLLEETFSGDVLEADEAKVSEIEKSLLTNYQELIKKYPNLPKEVIFNEKLDIEKNMMGFKKFMNQKNALKAQFPKGSVSPTFNYENHKGGKTSLESLKGKLVYIDVWATWCGPCKAEIPALKELKKEFHGKEVAFVSISVDKKRAHAKWYNFVKEKELVGIQLFADDALNSKFVRDYGINSIPRFILLDKEGKIINANAPRPSSKKVIKDLMNQNL